MDCDRDLKTNPYRTDRSLACDDTCFEIWVFQLPGPVTVPGEGPYTAPFGSSMIISRKGGNSTLLSADMPY